MILPQSTFRSWPYITELISKVNAIAAMGIFMAATRDWRQELNAALTVVWILLLYEYYKQRP